MASELMDASTMELIFLRACGLFLGSLVLQPFVWRIGRLHGYRTHILMLFVLAPALVCLIPLEISWVLAYILHISLSAVYLLISTGLTSFSPSIAIVERVARNMPGGLKRDQLPPPWFNDHHLTGARCKNLIASGLIEESGGILHLSARGRAIALCFLFLRRFLGLPDVAKG